jgi:hypothetical protein
VRARFLSASFAGLSLALVAAPAPAYHDAATPWVNGSAYTLRQWEASVSPWQLQLGVLDEVTVGTAWPIWFTFPWLGSPIPNASFKARSFFGGPLTFALGAVSASYRVNDPLGLNLELDYDATRAVGRDQSIELQGTAVSKALYLRGMAEWRFARWGALQLKSRLLLYRQKPKFEVEVEPEPGTHGHAVLSIGKVAPVGAHVNFALGAGYGYSWLPIIEVVLPDPGLLLDLDFFVRF